MNVIRDCLRSLVLALQYFTRVPIPAPLARWTGFDAGLQRASLAHFPAVGAVVAAVGSVAYAAAAQWLPRAGLSFWLAAVLSTAATAWVTGALHEDGLADTADGLGAGVPRERALEIMKDPRLGSFGAMALVLALMMKTGLLGLIGEVGGWPMAVALLLGAHVLSRGLTLVIVAGLPNVGSSGGSKSLAVANGIDGTGLTIAAFWCALGLAGAAVLAPLHLLLAGGAAAALALVWMRRLLSRRLQGFTGDGLGATQQLCEIAFYLGATFALGPR